MGNEFRQQTREDKIATIILSTVTELTKKRLSAYSLKLRKQAINPDSLGILKCRLQSMQSIKS